MDKKIKITGLVLVVAIIIGAFVAMSMVQSNAIQDVEKLQVTNKDSTTATLQWKKVSSADGYFIYESQNDNEYKKVATVNDKSTVNYNVTDLQQATQYKFKVNAFKQSKKKTVESENSIVVDTYTVPSQEEITSISSSDKGLLEVKWQKNDNAAGYQLEYTDTSDFKNATKVDIKDNNTVSKTVEDLTPNKTINVRINAYYYIGSSKITGAYSKTKSVQIADQVEMASNIDPKKPMIALTFDDGPGYNTASEAILDTLEKYNAKATFFMVGVNAKDHPENLKRKVKLGCELGNHTYDHSHYGSQVTPSDIAKCSKVIKDITGNEPTCFRSTGGNTTSQILNECKKENLPAYYWSLDTEDWKSRDANKVYNAVMNNVSDGDIILMHEIYESTSDAVEKMVPKLIAKGYQLVTVSQLVQAKTGKRPVAGQQYVTADSVNNHTS